MKLIRRVLAVFALLAIAFQAVGSFLSWAQRQDDVPKTKTGYENIVFAGSGTQPGVGVPMVLISGRLAAERIVGPVK